MSFIIMKNVNDDNHASVMTHTVRVSKLRVNMCLVTFCSFTLVQTPSCLEKLDHRLQVEGEDKTINNHL